MRQRVMCLRASINRANRLTIEKIRQCLNSGLKNANTFSSQRVLPTEGEQELDHNVLLLKNNEKTNTIAAVPVCVSVLQRPTKGYGKVLFENMCPAAYWCTKSALRL